MRQKDRINGLELENCEMKKKDTIVYKKDII